MPLSRKGGIETDYTCSIFLSPFTDLLIAVLGSGPHLWAKQMCATGLHRQSLLSSPSKVGHKTHFCQHPTPPGGKDEAWILLRDTIRNCTRKDRRGKAKHHQSRALSLREMLSPGASEEGNDPTEHTSKSLKEKRGKGKIALGEVQIEIVYEYRDHL